METKAGRALLCAKGDVYHNTLNTKVYPSPTCAWGIHLFDFWCELVLRLICQNSQSSS
jgi:hypothetical protein